MEAITGASVSKEKFMRIEKLTLLTAAVGVFAIANAFGADLLQNPGFEKGTGGWAASGAASRYSIAAKAGRNGTAALRYEKKSEGAAGENSIFAQEVDVQPNTAYVAGIWVKTAGNLRPVLRIATMKWDSLATAAATPSADWQLVQALFNSGENQRVRFQIYGGSLGQIRQSAPGVSYFDDASLRKASAEELAELRKIRISVYPEKTLRDINPLFFGSNTLFMIEDVAALDDGKIARYLREAPIRLLRFPGGDVSDNYHWKTGTLDDPKHFPYNAGPGATNTDEFMKFSRQAGAQAIFVVDLESGFVHHDLDAAAREAADWVAYSKQKGYNIKYWEIGNETYIYMPGHHKRAAISAHQYGEAFMKFARAMKAVDPAIQLGAVGPQDALRKTLLEKLPDGSQRKDQDAWWPEVVRIAGSQMDFMVVHEYYHGEASVPVERAGEIAALRVFLRAAFPGRYVPIALTEWNLNTKTTVSDPERAVLLAQLVAEYIQGGVDMANFWPLRYSGGWDKPALLADRSKEPRTAYDVLKLFSSNTREKLLDAASNSPYVRAFVTADGGVRRISMFLMNRTNEKQQPEISLRSFQAARASAQSLTAKSLESADHALEPVVMKGQASQWTCDLPPQSVTLVQLEQK
jgi:hypothetical protein